MTASHQDFIHFHGMLCHPWTAKRCIASFIPSGGRIIFAPRRIFKNIEQKTPDALYEFSWFLRNYEVSGLSYLEYLSLVVYSLTGLSTLLGMTKFVHNEENLVDGIRTSTENLPQIMFDYLGDNLTVVRHYTYEFTIPAIGM